jgi:hypothetical protein
LCQRDFFFVQSWIHFISWLVAEIVMIVDILVRSTGL